MSSRTKLISSAEAIGVVNENQVNMFIKHFNNLFKTLEGAFVNSCSAPTQGPTWSVPIQGKVNLATYMIIRNLCSAGGWTIRPGNVCTEISVFTIKQAQ